MTARSTLSAVWNGRSGTVTMYRSMYSSPVRRSELEQAYMILSAAESAARSAPFSQPADLLVVRVGRVWHLWTFEASGVSDDEYCLADTGSRSKVASKEVGTGIVLSVKRLDGEPRNLGTSYALNVPQCAAKLARTIKDWERLCVPPPSNIL